MASGIGNLPNQNMDFTPFDILTAEEMDDLVENIESLADGSGIGDGAIGTSALADRAVPPEKTALFNYQTDNSNSIANVIDGAIKVQMGWGQVLGNGTNNMTDTITYPEGFTTILGVNISWLGAKGTPAITSITDISGSISAGAGFAIGVHNITTTQATVTLSRAASTFPNTVYYGYSWIAWGIL